MDAVIIVIGIFIFLSWLTFSKPKLKETNEILKDEEVEKSENATNSKTNRKVERNDLTSTFEYQNQCWLCHHEIDSRKNRRCPYCGWYICTLCGSCKRGCNRETKEIQEKEVKKQALIEKRQAFKIEELKVGSGIMHTTFGRMEVTKIEKGVVYFLTTDGVEKKFVFDDTLKNYIDDIF